MSRYDMLIRVLDGIRKEAIGTRFEDRYASSSKISEQVWQARSRAYIHLYLKVMFGIEEFSERENFVSDGSNDGGVDGYYIDQQNYCVYLIQSKFRRSEENFESKPVEIDELLSMEIKRILGGSETDIRGNNYNGKIRGLQRRISEIFDIGRYSYKIVVLANCRPILTENMLKITDGLPYEIVDFDCAYRTLLYPVLSGSLFKAAGISISVDLTNKSTGSKIGYNVLASDLDCEITVVFVPTIEIAKMMSKYRNSILSYNPRNYLEFEGEKVNSAIRDSIINTNGNEFALLNNGITIICDESGINELSGKKNKAQLYMKNPQIINGGQTAFTLSRIFDATEPDQREKLFEGKEVMVKAIAVERSPNDATADQNRVALIEKISTATNSQTAVTNIDKLSNDPIHLTIQEILFSRSGILYERKRGEFADGIKNGYVSRKQVVNKTLFARIYFGSNGRIQDALSKRPSLKIVRARIESDSVSMDNFVAGFEAINVLQPGNSMSNKKSFLIIMPKVYAAVLIWIHSQRLRDKGMRYVVNLVEENWQNFINFVAVKEQKYVRSVLAKQKEVEEVRNELREARNIYGERFSVLAREFFSALADNESLQ